MRDIRGIASALGVILLLGGCAGTPFASGGTGGLLERLGSVETLRDAFNRDAGAVRLVLLLDPG